MPCIDCGGPSSVAPGDCRCCDHEKRYLCHDCQVGDCSGHANYCCQHAERGKAKGVRVTVLDYETGKEEVTEVQDDWLLTTVGAYYMAGVRFFGNGTAIITVKRDTE